MTRTLHTAVLTATLTLAVGASASSASAAVGPSCVPRGAQTLASAGSTHVYAYAGGPRLVCGSFGAPIELTLSQAAWALPTVSDSCIAFTGSSGSDKAQVSQAAITIFNLKDRTRTDSIVNGLFTHEVRIGRVLLGPGCTAVTEMGDTFWRIDARGAGRVPTDVSLDTLALGLQAPAAGARPVAPTQARSTSTFARAIRLSKRHYVSTLKLAFNRIPYGLTIFVDGRPVDAVLPGRQLRDLRPFQMSIKLPARISARLKAGRRASVESIICRGGCTKTVQTIKVSR